MLLSTARGVFSAAVIFCLWGLFSCASAATGEGAAETGGVSITSVLPFAGADQVRIDVTLAAGGSAAGATLAGRIESSADGTLLWQGGLGSITVSAGRAQTVSTTLTGLTPRLWSLSDPALYHLTVTAADGAARTAEKKVRFGFRSFETRDGRFWLNGKPIFLRSNSINPPSRGVPDEIALSRAYIEDYIRCLKAHNINTIRTTHDLWLDVCDELGMLVFSGNYGVPPLSTKSGPTHDVEGAVEKYKEAFAYMVRHPSAVIYVLSNEMSKANPDWPVFLTRCSTLLKDWDPTRSHIGNAGFGLGLGGDIYSSHPYNGWYGGTFLDFLRYRGDRRKAEEITPGQPWMLTECVGSYTVSDGRFNVIDKQLATQLAWSGHAANQTELGVRYQAFLVKQVVELFRRLRSHNPDLASVSPFTIMFYNWRTISTFDAMKPKPALEQAKISFQPVLLSWECWTSQLYAGAELKLIAHVVNDSDDCRALRQGVLEVGLRDGQGRMHAQSRTSVGDVPYYGTRRCPVTLTIPSTLPTGEYTVVGRLLEEGKAVSENTTGVFVAGRDWKAAVLGRDLPKVYRLYDTAGKTAAAFGRLGVPFSPIREFSTLTPSEVLVFGARSVDKAAVAQEAALKAFVRQGGRVLYLMQEPAALGTFWPISTTDSDNPLAMKSAGSGMFINPERPRHPVFAGIDRTRLELWSDYTGWNETQDGAPDIFPVESGFRFAAGERRVTGWDMDVRADVGVTFAFGGREALKQTAVLADYGRGLGSVALCEIVEGSGSVLLSGFNLIDRVGLDPVAERLLKNLLVYAASPLPRQLHPTMDQTVRWGDYASEQGLIIEKHNGLMPNVVYQGFVAGYADDPDSKAKLPGSFNNNPDPVYLTYGRRLMGPYDFTATCHNVDVEPKAGAVTAVFYATVGRDGARMIHRVKNATRDAATLSIRVNGSGGDTVHRFAKGQTLEVASPVPAGAETVCVELAGTKGLVLLETRFE